MTNSNIAVNICTNKPTVRKIERETDEINDWKRKLCQNLAKIVCPNALYFPTIFPTSADIRFIINSHKDSFK